jgi:hypothetical protein
MELMDPWDVDKETKSGGGAVAAPACEKADSPPTPRPISTRRRPAWAWARFLFNRVPALRCVAPSHPGA